MSSQAPKRSSLADTFDAGWCRLLLLLQQHVVLIMLCLLQDSFGRSVLASSEEGGTLLLYLLLTHNPAVRTEKSDDDRDVCAEQQPCRRVAVDECQYNSNIVHTEGESCGCRRRYYVCLVVSASRGGARHGTTNAQSARRHATMCRLLHARSYHFQH